MYSGMIPQTWRRYTIPAAITVIQWITDFSQRIKQLQNVVQVTQQGGAKELKVYSLICTCTNWIRKIYIVVRCIWLSSVWYMYFGKKTRLMLVWSPGTCIGSLLTRSIFQHKSQQNKWLKVYLKCQPFSFVRKASSWTWPMDGKSITNI